MIIPAKIIDYARGTVEKYSMDQSHGLEHFRRTAEYAHMLATPHQCSLLPGIDRDRSIAVVVTAAYVHDLVDKKYIPQDIGRAALTHTLRQAEYTKAETEMIQYIIAAAPYSVRTKRAAKGRAMIPHGPLWLATAIVVDADQLDAYRVDRCIAYQERRFAHIEDPQERATLCASWVRTILERRVLRYLDGYMNTPLARELAAPMHKEVAEYVATHLQDVPLQEYYGYSHSEE